MIKEEFFFDSRDEKTKIHAVRWVPDGEIRAILQIVHGMAEHVERYDYVANWFAKKGILVTAEDHLGHGKTVTDEGIYGYFCPQDPATVVVRDVHRLKKITEEKYPGVPYFILGHSMGSFITRNYLFKYGKGIKGAVISGTATKSPALIKTGFLLCNINGLFFGQKHISRMINDMATDSKSKIDPDHRFDWLCTDRTEVEKYRDDPLCGFPFTINGFKTLFGLIDRQNKKKNIDNMPKELPVKFISGDLDTVGDCGKGVLKAVESFKNVGMKNVECTLYKGLKHEILNEPVKDDICEDILEWMNKIIPNAKA